MRLLIIEDNKRVANMVRAMVARHFVADVAHTAEKGESLINTNNYDVIILDCMLPDQNGCDFCSHIRREGVDTPILMLTALTRTQEIVHGLESGADDYLTKPFDDEELLARLKALTRRRQSPLSKRIVKVGELTIDTEKKNVKHFGKAIKLRRKEIYILEFLMKNAGRVVTRNHILQTVWENDSDSRVNTIDVHIKNLRDKIDRPFGTNLIKTIHGIGYKIEHS